MLYICPHITISPVRLYNLYNILNLFCTYLKNFLFVLYKYLTVLCGQGIYCFIYFECAKHETLLP